MYLILQQDKPEDYVLATGFTTTIRDFIKMSFNELGIELEFNGVGENEVGVVVANNKNYKVKIGQEIVKVSSKYFRPTEVDLLIGDATKAKKNLGWKPKYDLKSLVKEMMKSDLKIFIKKSLK